MMAMRLDRICHVSLEREISPAAKGSSTQRGSMIMKIANVVSLGLLAAAFGASPAAAQAPADAVMIVPGVYTTPEISAKCTAYARARTQPGEDQRRQTLALACAQKLWAQEIKKRKKS